MRAVAFTWSAKSAGIELKHSTAERPMSHRTPLQQMLRNLLPSRHRPRDQPAVPEFADTRPTADKTSATLPCPAMGWAESSIELAEGTEIMEYPEDTATDLMDQFFAESKKQAS
jgi:hypothetical protein